MPTDFSESARQALELATQLAEKFGARIILLHVFEFPMAAGQTLYHLLSKELEENRRELYRLVKGQSEDALEALLHQVSGKGVGIEPLLIERGVPFEEIIRTAKELAVDLIVMSTHGRTAIPHLLIGSVAEKVVRKAPCPVLTVRSAKFRFEMP
jgi:nucleotide-binding universal stress UspA family protein